MKKATIGNVFKYPEEIYGDPLSYLNESKREEIIEALAKRNKNEDNDNEKDKILFTYIGWAESH